MPRSDLDAFEAICHRISLNIPDNCPWRWDKDLQLALTVVDRQDEIMVELPLALEFPQKWDFATLDGASPSFRDYFQSGFGVVPGQKIFSTDPVNDIVLFAVWWPWGDEEHISLRLGLISVGDEKLAPAEVKSILSDWLNLKEDGAG